MVQRNALCEQAAKTAAKHLIEFSNDIPTTGLVLGTGWGDALQLDKKAVASLGANLIGMSTLPEACIAALYDVHMLALAIVTNSASEIHSHEENVARVKAVSPKLGQLLSNIVKRLPE